MKNNLEFLYFLRSEIDQKISESGGERKENNSSETLNIIIKASFRDIVMMINNGDVIDALEYAERWGKRKWL